MLKYLLDTNIVIYTMKNRPQRVKRRFQQHHGQMGISTVTIGELAFGAEHRLALLIIDLTLSASHGLPKQFLF